MRDRRGRGPTAEAASAVAKRNGARHYRDHRELLARERLDGAIVATPNDRHAEVGIACAECGLPVLMEKPITDTLASGRALLGCGREKHAVQLAVGHHRRFDPAIALARQVIEGGRIGRLAVVECLWAMRKHDVYYDARLALHPPWRRTGAHQPDPRRRSSSPPVR